MNTRKAGILGAAVLGLWIAGAGCDNKFWDPSQVGRFRPTPAVNVILDSLGVAEERPVPWEIAEEPRPSDVVPVQGDYVLTQGDIVRVAIFELYAEGQMVTNEYVVNETGRISIPDVGVLQVAGLTETDLEAEIKRILSPGILKNPSVSVTMLSSQQRTFSVIGDGVDAPGRHVIPRHDFRLTDALALARGPRQFNVSNIYISRAVREPGAQRQASARTRPAVQPLDPVPSDADRGLPASAMAADSGLSHPSWSNPSIASERALMGMVPDPSASSWSRGSSPVIASVAFPKAYGPDPMSEVVSPSSFERLGKESGASARAQGSPGLRDSRAYASQAGPDLPAAGGQDAAIDWVFQDGRWMPVARTGPRPAMPQQVSPGDPARAQPRTRVDPSAGAYSASAAPGRLEPSGGGGSSYGAADRAAGTGPIEWVFEDGRWGPVPAGGPGSPMPQAGDGRTASAPRQPQPEADRPLGGVPGSTTFDVSRLPPAGSYPNQGAAQDSRGIEWVFQDGRWVPIQRDTAAAGPLPTQLGPSERVIPLDQAEPREREELTWEEAVRSRLIRVPTDKLLAGDPRYNVVVQPGDTIHVPVDIVGECCIMGNVNRAGYINLTGRPMTLKMAIAAAGGLGPLAYPKTCEVVRRIGDKREEIVLVDLDKIASGEQPDFFVKPNDLINVGTHYSARWRAVLRNAFRATYGFGFVYDRNFAYGDYGWPDWF